MKWKKINKKNVKNSKISLTFKQKNDKIETAMVNCVKYAIP